MQIRSLNFGGRCKLLGLAVCALWLASGGPAWHYFGARGIEAVSVSAVCCLLAGISTFRFARGGQPRTDAFAVLWGMVFRSIFALLGVFIMQVVLGIPYENYLIWLGLFYLVTLALETAILMQPEPRAAGPVSEKSVSSEI